MGLGPVGAIVYSLALFLNNRWARRMNNSAISGVFTPDIITRDGMAASSDRTVPFPSGNFEDTVPKAHASSSWLDPEAGIALASGAGALGVRLGQTIVLGPQPVFRSELGIGNKTDTDFMQSAAVGLVCVLCISDCLCCFC